MMINCVPEHNCSACGSRGLQDVPSENVNSTAQQTICTACCRTALMRTSANARAKRSMAHYSPEGVAPGVPTLPPSDATKALYSDSMLGPVLPCSDVPYRSHASTT